MEQTFDQWCKRPQMCVRAGGSYFVLAALSVFVDDKVIRYCISAKLAKQHQYCVQLIKAKFHYAVWSQTGSKLVADLLARASSLLAS